MNATTRSRRGQTLIEALVALSILVVGFIGIVALLNKSFVLNRTTTDDTQATYLAAEGIEVVKNLIDHDVYSGLPNDNWDQSFGVSGYYWNIDYTTTSTAGLAENSMQTTPLYYNPTTHMYGYNTLGATPTDFVRNIKINNMDNSGGDPVEIDVQSIVTWTDSGVSNTITLEDDFYNWYPTQ